MTLLIYIWLMIGALCLGSFLNVLIYRGPIIWGLVARPPGLPERYNLAVPRSHCRQCQVPLKWWHLIPLIGFFLARGRCSACRKPISWQYPFVELATLLIAIMVLFLWGIGWSALAAFSYFYLLLGLAMIDARTGFLPDALTLPLIGLGLLTALWGGTETIVLALFGALIGYGAFWLLGRVYRKWRGLDGLGGGDAKLLAGLGAWGGVFSLPGIMFLSSVLALVWIALQALRGRSINRRTSVSYGPFLALAGGVIFIFHAAAPFRMMM